MRRLEETVDQVLMVLVEERIRRRGCRHAARAQTVVVIGGIRAGHNNEVRRRIRKLGSSRRSRRTEVLVQLHADPQPKEQNRSRKKK